MFESSEKLNREAIRFASLGQYDDAIACFKRAITVSSHNYVLWFNLAMAYRNKGEYALALSAMETAHKINGENEEVLANLASLSLLENNIDDAYDYCMDGIDINPINPRFWNTAGVARYRQADYDEAADLFEHAVSLSPHFQEAVRNLRDAYKGMNNSAGIEECTRLLNAINRRDRAGSGGTDPA